MSILDFPRLHFQGFARIHAPTGNKNKEVDLSTNTAYMSGEPFDYRHKASEYHEYLYNKGPKFNPEGQHNDNGPFSMAMGWDFGGNGHFVIDAKIISTQRQFGQIDQNDLVVGRKVDMWGHYNEYLGTTVNRARIFDCDPASNWTTTIMLGQFTFGREGDAGELPNMFSGHVEGLQTPRWQNFDYIQELPEHCLNQEFKKAAVYQFVVDKNAADFLWMKEAELSPTVSLLREAMERDNVLGLVVQFSISNMSTPTKPDSPSFWELHGTIGLWCVGEMKSYPHGRLLIPDSLLTGDKSSEQNLSNLSLKITPQGVSLNAIAAVPCIGRSPKPGPGPTHAIEGKLKLGDLELRTIDTQRLIAKIPEELYQKQAYQLNSGIMDIPLSAEFADIQGEIESQGLCIVGTQPDGKQKILVREKEINLIVDDACLFIEYPDWQNGKDYAVEVEVFSFVRGRPQAVENIYLQQFYNPEALPQLRYKFERDQSNIGQEFYYPPSNEIDIVHFKAGKQEEIGHFSPKCRISTGEDGRTWVSIRGFQPGTARVLLSTQTNELGINEAITAYDNEDKLGFWSGVGSFNLRVLPDDWDLLAQTPDRAVDFDFIYQHILAYYEQCFSFMKAEVFSLADKCKVETYSRLMWQMSDPKNKNKTYYMPPTRDMSEPKAMLLRKFLRNQQQVGYVPESTPKPKSIQRELKTREELVSALHHAAELEVAVMLQYIYAGYSIPNYVTGEEYVRRGLWTQEQLHLACGDGKEVRDYGMRGVLLEVCHEEMIHFLMVNNILMAMGEPFYAATPNFSEINRCFPIEVDFALEPLNASSIQRFIRFETPDFLEEDLTNEVALGDPKADDLHGYGSLSELYRQIRQAIETIPDLFVVKKGNTGGEHHLFLREETNKKHPHFQFQVDDVESALFAIDFIVEQGEGCDPDSPKFEKSHYQQFQRIAQKLSQQHLQHISTKNSIKNSTQRLLPWNPAYPSLRNPTLNYQDYHSNIVTVPQTREVMEIFNHCYFLMMQLMVQHFGLNPYASLRRSKLMNASIDIMTGMMRPLGELLMTLPSGKRGKTAGPSFEIPTPIYIADPEVAYKSISREFESLARRSRQCEVIPTTVSEMFEFYIEFFQKLT